jgi:hypothetical protein
MQLGQHRKEERLDTLHNNLQDKWVDLGLCAKGEKMEEERGVGRSGGKRVITADGDVTGRMGIDLEAW